MPSIKIDESGKPVIVQESPVEMTNPNGDEFILLSKEEKRKLEQNKMPQYDKIHYALGDPEYTQNKKLKDISLNKEDTEILKELNARFPDLNPIERSHKLTDIIFWTQITNQKSPLEYFKVSDTKKQEEIPLPTEENKKKE